MKNHERVEIAGKLNKLLADLYVIYTMTQNFHWNVHGPTFYALHLLSEKQYGEMALFIDEVAERIRALGFFVEGTLAHFCRLTTIEEEEKVEPPHLQIEKLLQGHAVIITELCQLGTIAENSLDHATVDLLGRLLGFHEKASWMLRAQLN